MSGQNYGNGRPSQERNYELSNGRLGTLEEAQREQEQQTRDALANQSRQLTRNNAIHDISTGANVSWEVAEKAYDIRMGINDNLIEAEAIGAAVYGLQANALETIGSSLRQGILPTTTENRNTIRARETRQEVERAIESRYNIDVSSSDMDKIMNAAAGIVRRGGNAR
jgi:hypothetical protein